MVPLIANMPDSPEMERCRGQLRVFGGMPMTDELATVYRERFGAEFIPGQVYAQSEATYITCPRPGEQAPWGSAGRRNDDFCGSHHRRRRRELPDGEDGEVVVPPARSRSCSSAIGGTTRAVAFMRDGWFRTGDLGHLDDQGRLTITDRKEVIWPRWRDHFGSGLEEVLKHHPAVAEAAVCAVPSDLSEDDVKVTIILADDAEDTSAEDLYKWSCDELPFFAVPRYIEFRNELPTTPTGKVLKRELREDGVTDATWDREKSDVPAPRR